MIKNIDDIIGKEFLQNCGDTLIVLEKTNQRDKGGKGNILYKCIFKEFPFICLKAKNSIIKGLVGNPELEKNKIIGKLYPQNCGDVLKIIKRSEKRVIRKDGNKGEYFWEAEFQLYPYKVLVTKGELEKGSVLNPKIEEIFEKQLWKQHCGDSLKILGIYKKDKRGVNIWECEFVNHPYKILAYKENILRGKCNNPQIEIDEYKNKIIEQHCGDSIILINKENNIWEGHFIDYPNIVKRPLSDFLRGEVLNNKLPWRCKSSLIKYIKENFKNKKPTLQELAFSLKKSLGLICNKINEFGLRDFIDYGYIKTEENQVRNYIQSIYNGKIEKYSGKSEDKYREIDIYLPEKRKGIEYNGSIWHEEGNLNNRFSKPIGYHEEKRKIFEKKGIEILFIWDKEWFEDYPKRQIISEETKKKIKDFLQI